MTTIGKDDLPPPHLIAIADESPVARSTIGSMPFHRVVDPEVPSRRFIATWLNGRRELADAIERHHDEHTHAVLSLKLRSGEVVRVQWSAPPTTQYATGAAFGRVTGVFDEV